MPFSKNIHAVSITNLSYYRHHALLLIAETVKTDVDSACPLMQWIEGNNETGFSFNRKVNAVLIHPVAATKIIKLLAGEIFVTPLVIELVFL